MKKCPACAEEIQDDATVCKHCGRDFNAQQVLEARQALGRKIGLGCAVVLLLGFSGCFVLFMLSGTCGPEDGCFTEEQFGEAWPFTIPEGRLSCTVDAASDRPLVTFRPIPYDGVEYGVNGAAMSFGFPAARLITKPGRNLNVMVQRGLALCRRR